MHFVPAVVTSARLLNNIEHVIFPLGDDGSGGSILQVYIALKRKLKNIFFFLLVYFFFFVFFFSVEEDFSIRFSAKVPIFNRIIRPRENETRDRNV